MRKAVAFLTMAEFDTMWEELGAADNPLALKRLPDIKEKDDMTKVPAYSPMFEPYGHG